MIDVERLFLDHSLVIYDLDKFSHKCYHEFPNKRKQTDIDSFSNESNRSAMSSLDRVDFSIIFYFEQGSVSFEFFFWHSFGTNDLTQLLNEHSGQIDNLHKPIDSVALLHVDRDEFATQRSVSMPLIDVKQGILDDDVVINNLNRRKQCMP